LDQPLRGWPDRGVVGEDCLQAAVENPAGLVTPRQCVRRHLGRLPSRRLDWSPCAPL